MPPTPTPTLATRRSQRHEARPIIAPRSSIAFRVYLAAVFFLPVQLELEGGVGPIDSRFAPSDLLLAAAVILAPTTLRLRRAPISLLPVALVGTLAYGILLALVQAGAVTQHAVLVKFGGGVVLAVLAVVTATYARAGRTDRILATFLAGMAVWGLVAYVDWRIADILPFLEAKTTSRFGAMQFDPNNAGAGYAVAFVLAWRYGHHLVRSRVAHVALMAGAGAAIALSLSRGALLATAAAMAVVLVVERARAGRLARLAAVGVVLVVALTLTGFVADASDDFSSRPDNVDDRNELAENAVTDFVDSAGVGIGLGTYLDTHDEIVHNTALWLIVEMSLVGLALVVAVSVVPALAAVELRRRAPDLGSALLGAHVVMLVASMNIEALYQRPWWLVIGLLAAGTAPTGRR